MQDHSIRLSVVAHACHKLVSIILGITFLLSSSVTANADTHPSTEEALDQLDIKHHIQNIISVMDKHYVIPLTVPRLKTALMLRLANGDYLNINTVDQLIDVLDKDIRHLTRDSHLSLNRNNKNEGITHIIRHGSSKLEYNYAFEKIEILRGNIGYLKFNKFHPNENAFKTASSAFNFLKHAKGLIIDLRETVGGSPALVHAMLSYFFDGGTPLWHVLDRNGNKINEVAAKLKTEHNQFKQHFPLFILTGPVTASASELFTAVLQGNNKAIVVGERTGGAAYLVGAKNVNEDINIRISLMQPIVSATGENWEQTGIKPDIKVQLADALDVAHGKILEKIKN